MRPPVPQLHEADWLGSTLPMPSAAALTATLGDALREQAAQHPERAAIVSASERLTFADLAGQAGALAEAIQACDAPAGPVALILPAGSAHVAAWFACAAAGRVLLMVEPASPPAHNARLLEAAGAALVLHDGSAAALEAMGSRAGLRVPPRLAPRPLASGGLPSDAPAFLFPTSGSSGQPKLVVYSQATVQGKVQCSAMVMGVGPGDTVLIAGSHANFGVMHHALVFLLRGGTLCLHEIQQDGLGGLFAAVQRFGVQHLRFTPSLFRVVATMPEATEALRQARAIRFAGEPLLSADVELARSLVSPECAIHNLYGSTESAIFFWSDRGESLPAGPLVPSGRIHPTARFALLDDDGRPVPPGESGELVIRSRLHALGDWIDGQVDATRFPTDPLDSDQRLYATGDMARLLPDGNLVVQGRRDRLVKVRGQRVSLLEVEATLRRMPGCGEVTVLQRGAGGEQELVAFVVPAPGQAMPSDPGAWLARQLPRYMVPARWLERDALPLLPGGKVDVRELLRAADEAATAARAVSSATAVESTDTRFLRETWTQILAVPAAADDDNFFALGGDSLKLLELTLAVERHLGQSFSPAKFLHEPTFAHLARMIRDHRATPVAPEAAAPAASPPGAPYVARGRVKLQRIRHADGTPRGVVLGMPHYWGQSGPTAMMAARALRDYEIWSYTADLGDRSMTQDDAWLACAQEIAEQLAMTPWMRPVALYGVSIGGYIGWLVDRLLAREGWRPKRVIAVDAHPIHDRTEASRRRIDELLAGSSAPGIPMLMVHRSAPSPFRLSNDPRARWSALGVPCHFVALPTLSHSDLGRPASLEAVRDLMRAYVEEGLVTIEAAPAAVEFLEAGGQLHRLLGAGSPGEITQLDALLGDPNATADYWNRHALLVAVLASRDPELAWRTVDELAARHPQDRATQYTRIGLLSLRGYAQAAAEAAERWCRESSDDPLMRRRADPVKPVSWSWEELAEPPIGSLKILDRALECLAAEGGSRHAAQATLGDP